MTCKACGRDVPLDDINCFDCNAEGPFTRADRLTPWERAFAWLPVRDDFGDLIWLRTFEHRTLSVFGRGERSVRRAAIADTHPKDGDAKQAPHVSGGGAEGNRTK